MAPVSLLLAGLLARLQWLILTVWEHLDRLEGGCLSRRYDH
jgi:hypothetical protein